MAGTLRGMAERPRLHRQMIRRATPASTCSRPRPPCRPAASVSGLRSRAKRLLHPTGEHATMFIEGARTREPCNGIPVPTGPLHRRAVRPAPELVEETSRLLHPPGARRKGERGTEFRRPPLLALPLVVRRQEVTRNLWCQMADKVSAAGTRK